MKKLLHKTATITLTNIVLGTLIALSACFLFQESNFEILIDPGVHLSWKSIYLNNIKFLFIYSIPFIGPILYCLGFIYIYVLIGSSISVQGIIYTLSKLVHLPFEVFALSMPLIIYKNTNMKLVLSIYFILALLLLAAALIESAL